MCSRSPSLVGPVYRWRQAAYSLAALAIAGGMRTTAIWGRSRDAGLANSAGVMFDSGIASRECGRTSVRPSDSVLCSVASLQVRESCHREGSKHRRIFAKPTEPPLGSDVLDGVSV